MKRKIILSLLVLFIFFSTGASIAILYITNSTQELTRLVLLHQIENLRRALVISIQTVQSDLYTVHTPLGHKLDLIVDNVANLDRAAQKCSSCHHQPTIYNRIKEVQSLIHGYKEALSYYITVSANAERIEKIELEAADIGNKILLHTEDMSSSASEKLGELTGNVIARINHVKTFLFITLISAFFLSLLVSVNLTRTITKPIQELVNATRVIGSGSLGHTIAYKDKTEFGELASTFNMMSLALKDGYDNLEAANKELHREIMEHKRTEEALKESEERFRELFDHMRSGVTIFQAVDNGSDFLFKDFNNPKIKEFGLFEVLQRVWRTGRLEHHPISLYKDSRIEGWRDSYIYKLPSGELVVVYDDVTEHKKAEVEKKKLEARLQRVEKMEAIGNLAGWVAHDLTSILSGIISYPEVLAMDLPENSPFREPILAIQKSGQRAAVIVQDLLALARRGISATEVVNLNDIIFEYLKSPEHKKLKSYYPGVAVETNLKPDLTNILGSPAHLSKTLMNLVSNAAEAMPEGGKISISTENHYINKPIRGYDHVEEGDYVTLRVSDNGTGISSEDIDRIFEPFYTKKKMGRSGTGLGLAVVWGVVKDHKGYIDLQSIEGEGATFTLYFPVTRQEPAKEEAAISIEDYIGQGESILVVDDVEDQRELAITILNRLGYSVTTVSSGEEAVDYMKNNSSDLLILDMIMDPGIDGLETYRQILELHPGQRAIIVSGFTETERVKEAQSLGAGQYIKKPYTLEEIAVAVKVELSR
jgi:signal transduction histidine kinase/HAMP domain-containing protein